MSKYTKAREIIEKEIQDNAKTADKYFNYCKDMSDNVARKYNYLLQAPHEYPDGSCKQKDIFKKILIESVEDIVK